MSSPPATPTHKDIYRFFTHTTTKMMRDAEASRGLMHSSIILPIGVLWAAVQRDPDLFTELVRLYHCEQTNISHASQVPERPEVLNTVREPGKS